VACRPLASRQGAAALVNGSGTGLVEIMLDPPELVRLGPFAVRMRRLIVSTEDPSGIVAALST